MPLILVDVRNGEESFWLGKTVLSGHKNIMSYIRILPIIHEVETNCKILRSSKTVSCFIFHPLILGLLYIQGRTPIHFLSTEISESDLDTNIGEAYTWGNGSNYQLGSGAEGLQEYPARLESLRDLGVKEITAAKFHSMALTEDGQLYSWGFGRGGRLGKFSIKTEFLFVLCSPFCLKASTQESCMSPS